MSQSMLSRSLLQLLTRAIVKTLALFQNLDHRLAMSATAASVSLPGMQDEALWLALCWRLNKITVCKVVSTVSGPFSVPDEQERLCCCRERAVQIRGW